MTMNKICFFFCLLMAFWLVEPVIPVSGNPPLSTASEGLRVAVFNLDVTPPVGHKLAYGSVEDHWEMGLQARGLVLTGSGDPIVLLCLDWIGISNEAYDEFRRTLAVTAGTRPERVAVHVIHQHDAPFGNLEDPFVLASLHRIEMAAAGSLDHARPVTHIGLGEAVVEKVASTRRPLGTDGKVIAPRYTQCPDSALRAEPEGLIDPVLSLISFWNEDEPLAVLTSYATHPQSYYNTNHPNPDYPGIARFYRQLEVPAALHIHFTGAGGNIGAGKYNDGSHENRGILAGRLAAGMRQAWENSRRFPVSPADVDWAVEPVSLPLDSVRSHNGAAWKRYRSGKTIDLQCLYLRQARVLFMPGELFVEYQLAAKQMRPDLFVTMAAYGDLGPGYIPTAKAFPQGGYEVSVARVTPGAEQVLMEGMRKLLNQK